MLCSGAAKTLHRKVALLPLSVANWSSGEVRIIGGPENRKEYQGLKYFKQKSTKQTAYRRQEGQHTQNLFQTDWVL